MQRKIYDITALREIELTSLAVAPNTARALCIVGVLFVIACDHGQEAGASTTALSAEPAPASPAVNSPALDGYCPASRLIRLGMHTGELQNAWSKIAPRDASASRFGVRIRALPPARIVSQRC